MWWRFIIVKKKRKINKYRIKRKYDIRLLKLKVLITIYYNKDLNYVGSFYKVVIYTTKRFN